MICTLPFKSYRVQTVINVVKDNFGFDCIDVDRFLFNHLTGRFFKCHVQKSLGCFGTVYKLQLEVNDLSKYIIAGLLLYYLHEITSSSMFQNQKQLYGPSLCMINRKSDSSFSLVLLLRLKQ